MGEIARRVIVNSPYSEPEKFLEYVGDGLFRIADGRRPAGFWLDRPGRAENDRKFVPIPKVDEIRTKVKLWRESDYPGVTGITRELLSHWRDRENRETRPFFWCQLEAVETLIFLAETKEGHATLIPNDAPDKFRRYCTKLCTGGGKTVVMSMLIAWQVCNSVCNPKMDGYTRNILVVAPNITVRDRLSVLNPNDGDNYYERFAVVPQSMMSMMSRVNIEVINWQKLEDKTRTDPAMNKSVVKKPPMKDETYCREIVRDMRNILVINDEAHHAYRVRPEDRKPKTKDEKEEQREASVWIEGLDRIDETRGVMRCYDFTATPFVWWRGDGTNGGLYEWIVSDYSLEDGIEAGIVKTPMIVTRDNMPSDPRTGRSVFSHIYKDESVRRDLARKSEPEAPMPDLVRNAYDMLSRHWQETFRAWEKSGTPVPPVMITVANNTSTAARLEYSFTHGKLGVDELQEEDHILRIDSELLGNKSASEAENIREKSETVGQEGEPGAEVRNVISVGMLSEGWDARTVTHIMGLRAFTSQLLCEQVVGRGLRRRSYDAVADGEMFEPEYVNVFGVPFSLLMEESETGNPPPPKPIYEVAALPERRQYAITWPNVTDIRYRVKPKMTLNAAAIPELVMNAEKVIVSAEMSPVLNGKTNAAMVSDIDLDKFYAHVRMQTVIFRTALNVYDEMKANTVWRDDSNILYLVGEIVRLTEEYLDGGNIRIAPELFVTDIRRKKLLFCLNMDAIIKHMWHGIICDNITESVPIIPPEKRECSTGDMIRWWTSRPNEITRKSHINRCVYDSMWEESAAYQLDHNPNVQAWAKNDHLGFCVRYVYGGITRRYLPDFLVRLTDGKMLVLEVKGIETDESRTKHEALCEWVKAVNTVKTFGEWACDVVKNPAEVGGIIAGKIQEYGH